MDELELLKKDWKNQEGRFPKLSYTEIYQMMLKKSSSIVRWIFFISIIEFFLWTLLDIVFKIKGVYVINESIFNIIASIVSYGVLLYFIVRFYQNYKKIQVTDSAQVLMKNIIKTRNTVKQYVWVNIIWFSLLMISTMTYLVFFTDEFKVGQEESQFSIWYIMTLTLITTVVFALLIALLYRVIYGILIRRLKKNYNELKKLEI